MAIMKAPRRLVRPSLRTGAAVLMLAGLLPLAARSQITPAQANQIKMATGNRVEAMTILGGDFGLAGGTFNFSANSDAEIDVTKFGGSGDVGDPRKLGDLDIGWQPRLQGSMGFVDARNLLHSGLLNGDINEYKTFAIQFGGGARFWLTERLSVAPTIMGMYGHTQNEYTVNSAFMLANRAQAQKMGLVDWSADTWTLRPALDMQYVYTWDRTIFTLSSDPTYFRTDSFASSNPNVSVDGNAGSLANRIDVDVPMGRQIFGHELRTGGYFSRTELFGDLRDGLNTEHEYEIHGRLVLDFLNQLWKAQWIGLGGSYLWGSNFTGWTVGADVAFRF
jgi:hypothetical protein